MANESSRANRPRLPIKLTLPKQGRGRSGQGGGSRYEPFCLVDAEFRESLGRQVSELRNVIVPMVRRTGAVPARVRLHPLAVAKSHRPGTLFSSKTCPIIGAGVPGELFVKATLGGIDKVTEKIYSGDSRQIVKELSAVSVVEPVTPGIRRGRRSARDILRGCPRRANGFLARVKLFDFGEGGEQSALHDDFLGTCHRREISVDSAGYSAMSLTYAVTCQSVEDIEALADTVGVRSISAMPSIVAARPQFASHGSLPSNLPPPQTT